MTEYDNSFKRKFGCSTEDVVKKMNSDRVPDDIKYFINLLKDMEKGD